MDKAYAQSNELAKRLWAIANDLRETMDSVKFKDYILSVVFYRYLSERTEHYMDDILRDDGVTYRQALADPQLADAVREMSLDHLGYIIEPDMLYDSLIEKISHGIKKDAQDGNDKFSIEDLEKAIGSLVQSTVGQESEAAFDKIFDDLDLKDKDLGKEVSDRTKKIADIMTKVKALPFDYSDAKIDVLGTAYMILISLFASDAGKKGGEFFTPVCASTLLAKLATIGLKSARSVCDCAAGSGSLLLEVKNQLKEHKVGHYYCQDNKGTTYNLLRMNLLMHGVPYKQFSAYYDDTLTKDNYYEDGEPVKFTVQVANPPFSVKNTANASSFLSDPRYSGPGKLAPNNKADLAFVEHMVYHMADDGRVAVILPHGTLFRGGSEYSIRRYFIEQCNCVDAVIGLPSNMFHGTGIAVCIMLLKKNRNGDSDNILFVDASKCFTKQGTDNVMRASDIKRVVDCVRDRKEIAKFSRKVPLADIKGVNDYNLNISRYVSAADDAENWDVYSLMFGGMPEKELAPFKACFDTFPGLRDNLIEKRGESYVLKDDAKTVFDNNPAVKEYLESYRKTVGDMRAFLHEKLIDDLDSEGIDYSEEEITEELFRRLGSIPLVDSYEAYQIFVDEWDKIVVDLDMIHREGYDVFNLIDPVYEIKMKDGKEESRKLKGYTGRMFPYELIQEHLLKDDLAGVKAIEEALADTASRIDEAVENLTDEDREYTAPVKVKGKDEDTEIYDSEKGEIVPKAIESAVKILKKADKNMKFDEDSTEYRIVAIQALLEKEKELKSDLKKASAALEKKTAETIMALNAEDATKMLEAKWIDPIIGGLSGFADTVLKGYVRALDALNAKYSGTYKAEAESIGSLEKSLKGMLKQLDAQGADKLGINDWIERFGGADEQNA